MSKQVHPTARAYGIAWRDNEVLMVRAARKNGTTSLWWLPGGGIEFGETPQETVEREFLEETGITIANPQLLDVVSDRYKRPNGDLVHNIRIIYTVDYVSGDVTSELNGTTDLARWMSLEDLASVEVAAYALNAIERVVQTK